MKGSIMRHGPHHGAQKSTSTGTVDLRTSSSHVFDVTCNAPSSTLFSELVHLTTTPVLLVASVRRPLPASPSPPPSLLFLCFHSFQYFPCHVSRCT